MAIQPRYHRRRRRAGPGANLECKVPRKSAVYQIYSPRAALHTQNNHGAIRYRRKAGFHSAGALLKEDITMDNRFEVVEPTFSFNWQAIIDAITKALSFIFKFIAAEEGWDVAAEEEFVKF